MLSRLLLSLPLLITGACLVTPDDTALIALASSSTGAPVDETSGTTGDAVMTSTDAGSTSSGENTGDASTSSSGDISSTSSESTDDGATSTTGESLPTCVDNDPAAICKVFVSSVETPPNLLIDGFHALCKDLACVTPSDCGEYRALIRTDANFWDEFAAFSGSYILPSGLGVATGINALQAGLPLDEDEAGVKVPDKTAVWTGYPAVFSTCFAGQTPWASTAANTYAHVGYVGGEGETKWNAEQVTCDTMARVYCVEVPAE